VYYSKIQITEENNPIGEQEDSESLLLMMMFIDLSGLCRDMTESGEIERKRTDW
jgi:hypothetical protein